jgi:hypothetical protein
MLGALEPPAQFGLGLGRAGCRRIFFVFLRFYLLDGVGGFNRLGISGFLKEREERIWFWIF